MENDISLKELEYDKNGNLIPHDLIKIDIHDIEYNLVNLFPKSNTRRDIFNGYMNYNKALKELNLTEWEQWLNGSYSTRKLHPNDIDLVNLIDADKVRIIGDSIKRFLTSFGNPKNMYKVDGYILPIFDSSHPAYGYYEMKYRYWLTWFGHDRENNLKGILVVTHRNN